MKRLIVGLIFMMLLVACGGQITPALEPQDSQGTEQPLELQTKQDCSRVSRSGGLTTIATASAINDVAPRFYCGDFKFGDIAFNSETQKAQFDGRVFITIDENRRIVGTAIPKTSTYAGTIQEQATITGKVDRKANGDVFLALTVTFPTAGTHKFSGGIKIYKYSDEGLNVTIIGSAMDVENSDSDIALLGVVNKE